MTDAPAAPEQPKPTTIAPGSYTVDNVFGNKAKSIQRGMAEPILKVIAAYIKASKLTPEQVNKLKLGVVEKMNALPPGVPEQMRWRIAQLSAQSIVGQERHLARQAEYKMQFLPMSVQVPHPKDSSRKSNPGIIVQGLLLCQEAEHPYDAWTSGWVNGLANVDAADKFAGQIQEGKVYDILAAVPGQDGRLFIEAGSFDLKSVRDNGVPQFADAFGRIEKAIQPSNVADLLAITKPEKKVNLLVKDVVIMDSRTSSRDGQQAASIVVIDGSVDYQTAERFRGGLWVRLSRNTMHLAARKGSIVSLLVNGNAYQGKVRRPDGTETTEERVGWGAVAAKVTVNFSTDQSVPEPNKVIGTLPAQPDTGGEPEALDI